MNAKKYRLHLRTWRPLMAFSESCFLRVVRAEARWPWAEEVEVPHDPKLDGKVRRVKRGLLEHAWKS